MFFFTGKTRRASLIDAHTILDKEELLKEYAGTDAYLDCTLYLLAKDNPDDLERLNKYINTEELLADIEHVKRSFRLKAAKCKEVK